MSDDTNSPVALTSASTVIPRVASSVADQADSEEFLDGFLRVEAEVRAVPKDARIGVNLDVVGAVATALGALREINQLRADMTNLKGMDITQLDKLRDFAFALARTHSAYRGALGPKDPNGALAEELIEIRDQLYTDALALAKRELVDQSQVEKYRSGLGYKPLAMDVDGLVALFREAGDKLAGKTAVTAEELDRAANLAQRLVTGVGVKEQDPLVLTDATLLREQAFTLFINAYDEVRRAVIYLRWHEGDADLIAPSLWAGRTGKRTEDETPTTDAPIVAPALGAPTTGAGAAPIPAAPTTSAPIPAGFPGSAPFTS